MKISKRILTFSSLIGCCIAFPSFSQEQTADTTQGNVTLTVARPSYPYATQVKDVRTGEYFTVYVEDPQLVEKRLKAIENIMPMVYNESVQNYINYFLNKRPSFTKEMLEIKQNYFPIFEKYLAQNGMPDELKYLSILESGLNPKAISRSKAVGLWQFMTVTGREMGLTIDEYIDERMNIEKSTDAACKYLKRLYNIYGDWDLALASYNTGPGRIKRVIRSSGFSNYWDLHPYIHPDTRAYVPQFIALNYLMNYPVEHGIVAAKTEKQPEAAKLYINGYLDLRTLADLGGMDLEKIKKLNPHIKKNVLPDYVRNYELKIPAENFAYIESNKTFILDSASRRKNYSPATLVEAGNETILASNSGSSTTPVQTSGNAVQMEDGSFVIGRKVVAAEVNGPEYEEEAESNERETRTTSLTKRVKKYHKVKRGEFLNKIAARYDVRMNDIKKWNNKRSSKVISGERLVIYVTETQKVKSQSIAKNENHGKSSEKIKAVYHTVQPGDTLWNISQRYDGASIDDIKKMNNLSGNTVRVGQKIKVRG